MKNTLKSIFYQVIVTAMMFVGSVTYAQQFKVVGYMINWGNGPSLINTFDYTKVTHINYCFQNPDASGNLSGSNTGLTTLVQKAHAANVKVLVSLGGAGTDYDANLKGIWLNLITPGNRSAFIQKISSYVSTYNLDGVDVDIEGSGINGDYDGFVVALCNSLQPQGKLVTAAVKSDFGNSALVGNACLGKMDFINVMAYDQIGNWVATPGQHSSYNYSTGMIEYWHGRGVPYSKLILGVPFYGYGWNSDAGVWPYNSIIAKYPGASNVDQTGNIIYYNGIQTIKDKTTYACNTGLGGVMIWELTNDVTGQYSLLKAIQDAMGACGSIPTVSITAPANNASYTAGSSITFNANASTSSRSITKVEFFNGSTSLGSDNSAPYSYTWNNVAAGVYAINAIATNSSGKTATATITIHVTGPRGGTAWPIPGKIEAEDYDEGGQGFAYNDVTSGNSGGTYRSEDVDIEALAGGGYDVGYTAAGEYMKYSVNVASTGLYNFQVRIATTATGKSFHIEMDGTNVTGAINLPNTGAWTTYQTVTVNNVSLTQGKHEMKVYMDTDGFNLDYVNVVSIPGPTITFNNITKNYGDASFAVSANSNSTAAITYSITSGSQYATITPAGQVTIKGAGTVTIQANQAAGGGYNTGIATATLTINKANLTITADNKTKTYSTANPTLTMSYSGFVYGETSSVLSTQASISTTAVTNSNVGTYPITVSNAVAANYNVNYTNGTLSVNQASPSLNYTGATSGNQGSTISLTATSNSTGAITYSVANGTGTATLNGTTLNLTKAGSVTLTISIAATTNYSAASIQQNITINSLGNPTIVFNATSKTYGDASFPVSASSNSTGAITYSITSGTQYASITLAGQVTIKGAGIVTLQASQIAAGGYNAGTATATLTISKAPLTITADNKTKTYGTANPALTLSYSGFVYGETSSALSTQASISTTAVTNSNAGTYPITVSNAVAANYNVNYVNGTLSVNQASPSLTYTGATSGNQASSINLTASSNSTGAITYSVANGTGTATLNGTTLNLTKAGSVTLTISIAATTNYSAASIQQNITINSLGNPTIVFNAISKTYGEASFPVSASSNSTGAITYSITSGTQYASITSAGQVTIKGAGIVTLQASQVAADGYNTGTATTTLTITKATLTITADNKTKTYGTANPALTMSYSGFVYGETSSILSAQPITSTTAVTNSNAGTYPITLIGAAADNYTINAVNGALTVNKASTSDLSYTGPTSGNPGDVLTLSATSSNLGSITYQIISGGTGAATLSGSQLTLVSQGVITLQITIAGDANHEEQIISQDIMINSIATDITKAQMANALMNVFPNPIIDNADIHIETPASCNGTLLLCDMNGKVLNVIAEGIIEKKSHYNVPMSEYSNGLYIVKLLTENGILIKKISK